jgi:hypothetical protein
MPERASPPVGREITCSEVPDLLLMAKLAC